MPQLLFCHIFSITQGEIEDRLPRSDALPDPAES